MATILAVDPGVNGAFAVLGAMRARAVEMPTMRAGTKGNKQQVNSHELARLLRVELADAGGDMVAVVESVSAMPGQGVTSMFTFGRSLGRVEGVIATLGISTEYVTPRTWKAHFKLDADKENARALAQRLFPYVELGKKKDAGRAEALLIARFWHDRLAGQELARG